MYKLHERLCDRKLNDHFVSLCRTTHVFCFVQFYRSFIPIGIFMFALILFFFSSFISFWRHKYFIFISDESFIFLFHLVSIEFYIFLYKFLSQKARDNFFKRAFVMVIKSLCNIYFFLYYDVRIILHFEIIITYNLKILYLSSRVLFFSKKYN